MIKIKGDFLIKYYGIYYKDQNLWIAMEYCEFGSIQDLLREIPEGLNDCLIATIIKYAILGLSEINKSSIHAHLNVKTSNLLIDNEGNIKLTDWIIHRIIYFLDP